MKLRQGRRVPRHLYHQQGPEPADTDPPVGMVDTPELAATIVAAVNAVARIRELHRPVEHNAPSGPWCNACTNAAMVTFRGHRHAVRYPCSTIRALEGQ